MTSELTTPTVRAVSEMDQMPPPSPLSRLLAIFKVSDEQLMWRVQNQDDEQAFALLVSRWQQPIHRLCIRMNGDYHRGEDLTQEAFTRVFTHRKQYRAGARFSTYLWRIALNLCHDEYRRAQRHGESSLEEWETGHPDQLNSLVSLEPAPDAALTGFEKAGLVRDALQQLPETYRSVLILRHYENLKFSEIGEVLNIPEGTVKSRMAEALSRMAVLLKSQRPDISPT